jgi:surfactin synthase thioesterase subunit
VTREDLEGWRRHTSALSRVEVLPGDHFFVYAPESPVVARLTSALQEFRAALSSPRLCQ